MESEDSKMACVRKKGDLYYYRFKVKDGDSYRYIERGGNFKTKSEALRAGQKAEAEWNTQFNIFKPREVLYKTLLNEYQINFCNIQYKGSTLASIRKDVKIVQEYLGETYVHMLTTKMLQEVIVDLAKRGYTKNRLTKVKSIMYKSLRYAQENSMIKNNVASAVYVPSPRAAARLGCASKKELRALTREEINRLFTRFPEGTTAFIPLLLAYRCGMRLGECFGLEVQDVEITDTKKCLHIRQQLGYHGHNAEILTLSEPKYESCRVIDLDDSTAEILEAHIRKLEVLESIGGDNYQKYYEQPDGRITLQPSTREIHFLNRRLDSTGKLATPRIMQHVSRVIHGFGSSIGKDENGKDIEIIPDFSFHQLRHTHCSELVAAGFDIQYISARLGHRDCTTTYRYYCHMIPQIQDKSVKALNGFFGEL